MEKAVQTVIDLALNITRIFDGAGVSRGERVAALAIARTLIDFSMPPDDDPDQARLNRLLLETQAGVEAIRKQAYSMERSA